METDQSEAVIARSVVTELQRQGYETYEEVSMGWGTIRADVIAVRGPVVMVVECKQALSLKFLDQLLRWPWQAHYVIGAYRDGRRGPAVMRLCRYEGIGLWSVLGDEIHEEPAPRLHRTAATDRIRKQLVPEQRSGQYAAAGSQAGGYFTPFRKTCDELKRIARETPGIPLRDALTQFKHHYASDRGAMSSVPLLVRKGVIKGLRVEGKPLQLFAE